MEFRASRRRAASSLVSGKAVSGVQEKESGVPSLWSVVFACIHLATRPHIFGCHLILSLVRVFDNLWDEEDLLPATAALSSMM